MPLMNANPQPLTTCHSHTKIFQTKKNQNCQWKAYLPKNTDICSFASRGSDCKYVSNKRYVSDSYNTLCALTQRL